MKFTAIIEKGESGWYVGRIEEVPAAISQGKTIEELNVNFEIIGEASNRLPDERKDELKEINWLKIRGFCNRLVHGYFGINYEIVWQTKEELLPSLIQSIQNKLNTTDQ